MATKKVTFKQRIRKNDLRQRNESARDIKKRMKIANRRHNRFDAMHQEGRSMEELVTEVSSQGASIAARDNLLDPRALADLLTRVDAQTGSKKLVVSLDASDPAALPELALDAKAQRTAESGDNQGNNKNRYKHKGSPYVFWENVGLHPLLIAALKSMKFTHPTPVQEEVLPTVMHYGEGGGKAGKKRSSDGGAASKSSAKKSDAGAKHREDVVVSAETGSGKTLVFALPILHDLLEQLADDEPQEAAEPAPVAKAAASASPNSEKVVDQEQLSDAAQPLIKKRRLEMRRAAKGQSTSSVSTAASGSEPSNDRAVGLSTSKEGAKETTTPSTKASPKAPRVMHSLIVSPTRELAIQIQASFLQLAQHAKHIRIGCVVGGMAPERQQRVLNRAPHILICTPGRLWDLLQKNEGCYLGHSISRRLKYVILDEADKLLVSGRFEELKSMLERIHCDVLPAGFGQRHMDTNEQDVSAVEFLEEEKVEEDDDDEADENEGGNSRGRSARPKVSVAETLEEGTWDEVLQKFIPKERSAGRKGRTTRDKEVTHAAVPKDRPKPIAMPPPPDPDHRVRTFVTSATLSLQTNYTRKDFKGSKSIIRTTNANTMASVLEQLSIREKSAAVFNLTPDAGVVAKINETFLRCPDDSKDLYLYYFLRTFKERTIIFVNAISMLRRLTHILEVLGLPVVGLHASMQQRQRLKFIERFRTGEKRILVATDIASRGLDIDGLRYVLHYQVPRSTDAYIHRCGRTARCGGTGLSLLMVNAAEYVSFKKLILSLGRSEKSMETFSVEPAVVHHLHPHLKIALQIDKLQREVGKTSAGARWVKRMSDEAEVDADDMIDEGSLKENAEKLKVVRVLKKQLEQLVRKDTGHFGGKGAFRSGAKAIGSLEATQHLRERAERQTVKGAKF